MLGDGTQGFCGLVQTQVDGDERDREALLRLPGHGGGSPLTPCWDLAIITGRSTRSDETDMCSRQVHVLAIHPARRGCCRWLKHMVVWFALAPKALQFHVSKGPFAGLLVLVLRNPGLLMCLTCRLSACTTSLSSRRSAKLRTLSAVSS